MISFTVFITAHHVIVPYQPQQLGLPLTRSVSDFWSHHCSCDSIKPSTVKTKRPTVAARAAQGP